MAALPNTAALLRNPSRRSFLWSFTSFGLVSKTRKKTEKQQSEAIYRFLTADFEVRMSVQYFANSAAGGFRFRDQLTNRAFCLSASGEEDPACLQRFVGSMAIAHYDFRSRRHPKTPLHVRERVHTIDQDSRMSPRPPFERILAAESEVVSDIQAFGYNPEDPLQANLKPLALWCLLRQDLYLNEKPTAFLIVHWKHMVNSISLVDVIPGEGTEWIAE
jgi:hypothetical protein